MRIGEGDFAELLSSRTPLLDVRAPAEYQAGSFDQAVNLPLLDDGERHTIGLTYKEQGSAAAIELGHRLVSGELREARMRSWLEHARDPHAVIFCFRGGLRSQTVQGWLAERGVSRPLVEGGYKSMRGFLLRALDKLPREIRFEVVSGPTGSGKTEHLRASGRPHLNLEELANHRGSAFGANATAQPSQATFENRVACALLRLAKCGEPVLIEDESRLIGHRAIPPVLFQRLRESPRTVLALPIDLRVENVFQAYVANADHDCMFDRFQSSVRAISRRLGGLRTQEILRDLADCRAQFEESGTLDGNRIWIRKLLEWYYDPTYTASKK